MKYIIKTPVPQSRFVFIEAHKEVKEHGPIEFQLPSWRPGRYELGNFAKNLRGLVATTESGTDLPIHKINKDRWRIDEAPVGKIILQYEYYAAQPDAGACWLDNDFLYLNPVHCILYDPIEANEPYFLHLHIPSDYQIACSLPEVENNVLRAENLDELLDAPFFAAKSLQHRSYSVNDYQFHIWLYGECQPDWTRIINDFEAFTRVQLDMMKSFPVAEYHFLVLLLPYRFYHGVEHKASTVLALGPGYQLMNKDMYSDLMGVASHELFHAWNVKTLRPHDFVKYDYTKENYSRLGWVYEGFTTYYGDLFLARSKFFNTVEFFEELNQRIQKHKDNYGRFWSSVAESSFDTWLDGYVPGVPARKTSIYDEGCIVALMLDLYIRRSSKGKNSLDDLYVHLFNDFSTNENGYRESDLLRLSISLSDQGVEEIFNQAIHSRKSYEEMLQNLLPTVGCWLSTIPSKKIYEQWYGLRVVVEGGITKVLSVLPSSPAEIAGIAKDDEISSCNGWKVESNLNDLCALKEGSTLLTIFSQKKEKQVTMKKSSTTWFDTLQIVKIADADPFARESFTAWTNLDW
ncbi:MAG: M61 family metallopeptidase [Bacteroidetes bacterium]|nr:M61 family metallopeptidase [Bacteroidota bacterium]